MAMRPAGRGVRRPTTSSGQGGVQPVYVEFSPVSEWKQDTESESDILLIYLPGFPKNNLKVSTEGQNIVRARGDRLDAGNKWSRFQEDYQVPERCDIRSIRAKFEGGILSITMPWRKEWIEEQAKEPTPEPAIPAKEPNESIPQKGSEVARLAAEERLKSRPPPEAKASVPQKARVDDIPPKALTSPSKDRMESIRPKLFHDSTPPNVSSQPPRSTAGASDKGNKEEKMLTKPLPQKGQEAERDKLADSPEAVKSATTGAESGQVKGKSVKSEKLESSKEESGVDNKRQSDEKNRVARGNRNEESEKQTTAATAVSSDYDLRNYMQAVKSMGELKEERQLLVNVGAAVLVIVALGTYIISSTYGSGEAKQ